MKYAAMLTGADEVPPVSTAGKGMVSATYDTSTKKLSWTTESSGLTSDITAAHFHGPAKIGENAKPVVPVELGELAEGAADLTAAQATDLADGRWYFNIHTSKNPNGEIRGQILPAQ